MIFPLHAHAWSMCSMYVWGYSDGPRVVLVRCQETKELPTKKGTHFAEETNEKMEVSAFALLIIGSNF